MASALIERRIRLPIREILKRGVSPERVAASIALALVLGVFPALGTTTILCAAAALSLRLNFSAMQIASFAAYPLQLALFIPFMRLGAKLFGESVGSLTVAHVMALIESSAWQAIHTLWTVTMHAIVAWLIVGVPVGVILYFALLPALRRIAISVRATSNRDRKHSAPDFSEDAASRR